MSRVAAIGRRQALGEVGQCPRDRQFAADSGEAVFDRAQPGQAHPRVLASAEPQPRRRARPPVAVVN
jgi:hypothetical protein